MVARASVGRRRLRQSREFKAVYLIASWRRGLSGVEGHLRFRALLAFADLGMEAIYEFDVRDMP